MHNPITIPRRSPPNNSLPNAAICFNVILTILREWSSMAVVKTPRIVFSSRNRNFSTCT